MRNFLCLGLFFLHFEDLRAESKTFLLTLPVVTIGREGTLRLQRNFQERGALGLEWTEWGLYGRREELSWHERKEHQGSTLISTGHELAVSYSRYMDSDNMSGFYWDVSMGYRVLKLDWTVVDKENSKQPKKQYYTGATGPSLGARLGYQFVGETYGITVGSFLGGKYFLSDISDKTDANTDGYSYIGAREKTRLQDKIAASFKIGIELGWAF